MYCFKIENDGEVLLINPIHIVYAKQNGTRLTIKTSDGSIFEKTYPTAEDAKRILMEDSDIEPHISYALRSISKDWE